MTCLPFLLLLGSLVLFDFVFTNTDCGDFQTGIRIAVLAITSDMGLKKQNLVCVTCHVSVCVQ